MTDVETRRAVSRDGARAVTTCRVCGGSDWCEVVSFGEMALADSFLDRTDSWQDEARYPLDVISCRGCRLMSLTHVVDPEILYRSYPYETSESQTIADHMRYVAAVSCERFGLPADGLVVEIGSNTGVQLLAFRERGLRVVGVDPALNIAEMANARGVETVPDFFSEETAARIVHRSGRADLVLGRHVFAHIDDVGEVCRGVRALLHENGVFAVEVPYAVDMLEKVEFDTIYHEHLSYFTMSALTTLFERHDMKVVDVEKLSVHGGSILVFAGRADGTRHESPVVREMVAHEVALGLTTDEPYARFRREVGRNRDALVELVGGLVRDGYRVAGYGAPAKGNTLLGVCGLGPETLSFCLDTTPSKQSKLLPGVHIPVYSPEEAGCMPVDYYVLLAWNYYEEILRKEGDFVARGGRFIIPNPRPAVVPAP